MRTFQEVIEALGGVSGLRAALSISYEAARKMRDRDNIPAVYWPRLIDAAARLGLEDITPESLVEIVRRRAEEGEAA